MMFPHDATHEALVLSPISNDSAMRILFCGSKAKAVFSYLQHGGTEERFSGTLVIAEGRAESFWDEKMRGEQSIRFNCLR